jgi:hypothetical protein
MEVTDDHGRFLFSVPLDLPSATRERWPEHLAAPFKEAADRIWVGSDHKTWKGFHLPPPLTFSAALSARRSSSGKIITALPGYVEELHFLAAGRTQQGRSGAMACNRIPITPRAARSRSRIR